LTPLPVEPRNLANGSAVVLGHGLQAKGTVQRASVNLCGVMGLQYMNEVIKTLLECQGSSADAAHIHRNQTNSRFTVPP